MLSKPLAGFFVLLIVSLLLSSCSGVAQPNTSLDPRQSGDNTIALITGPLYEQSVDPSGKLLLSAWLDPDGSDNDQYVWDSFIIPTNESITEIDWFGVYDPLKFGAGGPVVDFSVSIFASNIAGTEPAIANPPLVIYLTGGNAGETMVGTVNGAPLYAYAFNLPSPFYVAAGVKYWVEIEAFQHGTVPDWCLAAGWGGNGSHFARMSGAGGDIMYRTMPGDAAFTLLGPVPEPPIPTDTPTETPTDIFTHTPTNTPTDTASPTPVPSNTPTDTATSTPTNTPTDTPTNTPTDTATYTPTATGVPTSTPSETPTNTATSSPTDTPTSIPTNTTTATPTTIPTNTPTYTPTLTSTVTPPSNTPGKVTGGGTLGSENESVHVTFGFTVNYSVDSFVPKGNLTYQDHKNNLKLKAASFDLLVISGNQAWFTGSGTLDGGQIVHFTVEVFDLGQTDMFSISIPDANGYFLSGTLSGGNITIH